MLPKITRNKFSSGYEKSQYFNELLDDYIHLNEKTNEAITPYNTMCINLITSTIDEKLNPLIIKLAVIGKLSYTSGDSDTNRSCYQIIRSLQKQRSYYRLCKSVLEKAAINKNYYIIIKYNLNKGVVDRCNRLNENLLPNLIADSKLNVYTDYLAERNVTLEQELKKYVDYDFESEEFLHYVSLVGKRIDRHFKTVSEDKRIELLAGYEKQKLLEKQRKEAKAVEKATQRAANLENIRGSLSGAVTQIYDNAMIVRTTYMRTGSVAQKLYQKVDGLITDKCIDACLNDRVVVLVLHPRNKTFSTSNLKYYVRGRKSLVTDFILATMLLEKRDSTEIQEVIERYKDKYILDLGYISRADEYILKIKENQVNNLRHQEQLRNQERIKKALSLGIDENSTWEEINEAIDRKARANKARSIGIPEDSTWEEINEAMKRQWKLEIERRQARAKAEVLTIQRNLPSLPVANSDIRTLSILLSGYGYKDLDDFGLIIHLINQVSYEYGDIAYLTCIPDKYIARYAESLYDFTYSMLIYCRNMQGVAYKLLGKIDDFKASNKDFNNCILDVKEHPCYDSSAPSYAKWCIDFYLVYLRAIKSEGITQQRIFYNCPALEKYYREYLHSDLNAFVKFIGYTSENTSHIYRSAKKIMEII